MQTYSNHFAKSRIETGNTVVLDGGTIILSNVAFAAATRENLGISDDPQMRLLAPSFDEPPIVSGDVCRPSVTSSVGEGAVIDLEITASCDVGSEFVVHHNGMMFSDVIDSTGFAHVTVPALTEKAIIIVDFPNASPKLVIEHVADASRFTRSVLQWKGDFDLSKCFAMEGGFRSFPRHKSASTGDASVSVGAHRGIQCGRTKLCQ